MKKFLTSAAVALASCAPAQAGNLADIGLDDPQVYEPPCTIVFGLLPCNEVGHVRRPTNERDEGPTIGVLIPPGLEVPGDDGPGDDHPDDGPGDDGPCDDGPGDDHPDDDQGGGQNPGNDKPVGGSPFDGEKGEEPSGVDKN